MNMLSILHLTATLLVPAGSSYGSISREELKKALNDNPDLVVEALGKNKKGLAALLNDVQREQQALLQRQREEAEKKEFDDAIKNPKQPEVGAGSHVLGDGGKAVYTLVEYSDFQCPYCARAYQTVEELRKKYGPELRLVYKNAPLPFHPQAMPAAQYFEAAMLQSSEKGWQFYERLFKNQNRLGDDLYKEAAKELGLDFERMRRDAQSQGVKDRIAADQAEADKFGFQGTPGFLLNGVPIRGAYPAAYFDQVIQRLKASKKG